VARRQQVVCPSCKFPNASGAVACLACKGTLGPEPLRDVTARHEPVLLSELPAPVATTPTGIATGPTLAWLVCDPLPPLPLAPGRDLTIGRAATCDLVLPHEAVSRVHAVVRVVGEQAVVEDRSSFGCFVDGARLEAGGRALGKDERLTIGPYVLRVAPVARDPSDEAADRTRPLTVPVDPMASGAMAMQGRFERVNPMEILQVFDFHKKTATLRIANAPEAGELVVVEGRPVRARLGDLRGLDAAIRIALLARGQFSVHSEAQPGAEELSMSMTQVLLEANRREDESRHAGPPTRP
jgi:hypothetical protein